MLDDLPGTSTSSPSCAARSRRDLVLRDEIAHLVGERGGRLHEVVGPALPGAARRRRRSARLVPDIARRDVYVCGPGGFMDALIADARSLGVPGSASTTKTSPSRTGPEEDDMKRSPVVIAATVAGRPRPRLPASRRARRPRPRPPHALTTGNAHHVRSGAQTVVGSDQALAGGLGDIQVKVTAANGKLVSVGMAKMNLHGPQSRRSRTNVIPQLEQQAMANGGPIQAVSGATYTSQAFAHVAADRPDSAGRIQCCSRISK